MLHKSLVLAAVATLAGLLSTSSAQAWGGAQATYTTSGPGYVYQTDRNSAAPMSGMYSGTSLGHYGWGIGGYQPNYANQPNPGPTTTASVVAAWKHRVDQIYGGYNYGGFHGGDYFTSPFGADLYGTGVWRPY